MVYEKFAASRLNGAPPGYGLQERGELTEKVRNKPYSVLLWWGRQAHPDIFNVPLAGSDDGVLTDSKGRKVDFSKYYYHYDIESRWLPFVMIRLLVLGAKDIRFDQENMETQCLKNWKSYRLEFIKLYWWEGGLPYHLVDHAGSGEDCGCFSGKFGWKRHWFEIMLQLWNC